MSKIIVLYQDWNNSLSENYSEFERWFKEMDGAYDEKHEYYIIALGNFNKKFKKDNNITIEIIKSNPINQFIDLFKINKKIKTINKTFKADYIYSPFTYLLSSIPKSKSYVTIGFLRAKDYQMVKAKGGIRYLASYILYLLDKIAFNKIDLLFHNGKSLEAYARKLGYKNKLIYNPRRIIDIEYFNKSNSKKIINKFNLKDKKVILIVSRLTTEKNIILGIKTMKLLHKDYTLLIVGDGDDKIKLEKLVKKLNLENRIYFIGQIKHHQIWKYFKASNILWLLSKTDFEGTPNVLQEALYAKLPVIVSNIPAMKNIIENNNTGIILKNLNKIELKNESINLIENNHKYSNIQKNGYIKINNIIKKHNKVSNYFK